MKPEPATITLHMTEAESEALQWLLKNDLTLWGALLRQKGDSQPLRLPKALAEARALAMQERAK